METVERGAKHEYETDCPRPYARHLTRSNARSTHNYIHRARVSPMPTRIVDSHKHEATATIERDIKQYTHTKRKQPSSSSAVTLRMIDDKRNHPSLHALIGCGLEIA